MRLEKVEIAGFKSFCDRQELDFKGGVTGIVGPNGCGKSNISDAISWVLGEQSAKSLRGTSMADVIFAGSQSRQPLAMAEVSLKVTGLNGNSPDGQPECTVARRLYRNGESEYLMNGHVCRLRDVHELFMDTGLGSKAYSIIEQGKIGMILSTKPADRRALIEEAAGITKYKARRRQTSLKLEAAQQNLLRVNDIVHEVEKQLDSLKRQAGKARRYRVLRDELTAVLRVVFGRRFVELSARSHDLASRLELEREREQAVSITLDTEQAQMEARRTALYDEEARLEEVRRRLNDLTLAVDRNESRSGYCREQMAQAQARAEESRTEAASLEERIGPAGDAIEARRAERRSLGEELAAAEAELASAESAVQERSARQAGIETDLESARETQIGVISRIATLENARENVSGNAGRADADLQKLAAEREELERERAGVEAARERARRREAEAKTSLDALVAGRDAARAREEQARARTEELAGQLQALQSEHDGLAGRLASLREIVEGHTAFDEGVRALLERAAAGGDASARVLGVVADAIEADPDCEAAVESFLGDRLQALLVPDAEQARRAIRDLEASDAGRCTFLSLDVPARPAAIPAPAVEATSAAGPRLLDVLRQWFGGARPGPAEVSSDDEPARIAAIARSEPRVRGLLRESLRISGPHARAIAAALPDALVVDSLDDALDLLRRHGPLPCVTLGGEVVRGALVTGGRSVQGLLAPKREIREIDERLAVIEHELGELRERIRIEREATVAAAGEAAEVERSIHAAEKELVSIRHEARAAEDEAGRLHRKASVLDAERSQAEQEKGAAAVRLAEIEQSLSSAESERRAGTERLAGLSASAAEARQATDAERARAAEVRSRMAALRERLAAVEADVARLETDREELLARIEASRARGAEADRQREELAAERSEVERLLAEALGERERIQAESGVVEDAVRDIRNELEGREAALKERRREREVLRDAVSDLEVQQARTGSDLDHLARECHQAVELPAAEAARLLTDEDQARAMEELEERVADVRGRLDRMGPVNILAVEQTQELTDRLEFLTAQRQDLVDSISELESAIRKIDRTSRERFREAFQVINQHFGEIFRQLFGGGTAGLSLIDEQDLLETGIDVMAQPPGKRLQNVMLLSGGEKALTAIALLFAIFQYKPSPFCILDEVDAPLDDANIGRFVRMLEGLKEQTQFVLITHSRKTMEIADQLYGVTMEEPGVSKLVSVRFG